MNIDEAEPDDPQVWRDEDHLSAQLAETVAKIIRRERRALDLTQEDLASESGIPVDSIRNYENARRKMSLTAAVAISTALGISVDSLAGRE